MQDKFIKIILPKRKQMLQLGVAKMTLLPSVNRCLYVFLFLCVLFFFKDIFVFNIVFS